MDAKLKKQKRRVDHSSIDGQLSHLVAHPVRIQAFTIFAERAASANEIAKALGEKLPTVCHHVNELKKMNLIEKVDEKKRRGATEIFYRALTRPLLSSEEWDKLSVAERQRFSIWIVQLVLGDAAKSFAEKLFDARSNRHLSRIPMVVDEKGFDEATQIQNKALNDLIDVQANSCGRIATGSGQGFNIVAAMLCFEMPKPNE